ncbi:MAG: hypothetical protein ABIP54_00730 [Candidatus Andersenbacteria bacterium]
MKSEKEKVVAGILLALSVMGWLFFSANPKGLELFAIMGPGNYNPSGSSQQNADTATAAFTSIADCEISLQLPSDDDPEGWAIIKPKGHEKELRFQLVRASIKLSHEKRATSVTGIGLSSDEKKVWITLDDRTYRIVFYSLDDAGVPFLQIRTVQYDMNGKIWAGSPMISEDFQKLVECLPRTSDRYWYWMN